MPKLFLAIIYCHTVLALLQNIIYWLSIFMLLVYVNFVHFVVLLATY